MIDSGKQALGIFSGNFENIEQIQKIIVDGNLIDTVSDLLDISLEKLIEDGKLDKSIGKAIKVGKSSILNNVEKNIENTLNTQTEKIEKIDKYISNWKDFYKKQNFEGMQKEYNKIEKELKKLIPLENTIKNARYVENIHNLIKNNGQNFNLSEDEIDLAKKLNI